MAKLGPIGLKAVLQIIGNKLTGKADVKHTHSDYAKKSDIVNVYRYKGSVDTYSNLPRGDLNSGDVYNVEDTGKNYAWTGSAWDDLGGSFEFEEEEITEEEVERICNEVWGA